MVTDELRIELTADTGNAAQNISQTADALTGLGETAKTADSDVSRLVRAMSEAAASMVSVAQNILQSSSGLEGIKSGSDAAETALSGLNMQFDALSASVQQSYTAFDSASASVRDLSVASENSAAAIDGIISATDSFASRMGELQTNTQGTSDSMNELHSELSGALASIRSFSDNMSDAGKDAREASDKIKELAQQVRSMPTQQPFQLAKGFKTLKGIVATLGIGKFVKDCDEAYKTQMQNELKLTSHMRHRMNATNEQIQGIKDLASTQQKIGVIGDEIQLAGAQQLTTYARQASTLQTLLPAMNNLIAQQAGYEASVDDATSAADMLGRALNGQYTSLKRMGVSFSEAQENVLKYGTEEQKAAVLADAINSKVGNMNELLAQTPAGKVKQLENEFGDLQEQIGATFQPLISTIVPIVRGTMETLRVPILNVSRGISVIGQAITSVDNPAVRGIALAAASLAVLHKLKTVIGSTSAALLLLGVAVSALTGSMVQQQDDIGAIVENAYKNAQNAIGGATDKAVDFNSEISNSEKKLNRLAGFDTITKLSGGSSNNLTSRLLGAEWQSDLEQAKSEISDFADTLNSIGGEKEATVRLSDVEARQRIRRFETDATTVMNNLGNIDVMYAPLERMTKDIEDLLNANGLDGTGFVNLWKGVGDEIYNAMNNKESGFYKGLSEWGTALKNFRMGVVSGDMAGDSLYGIFHMQEIVDSGQAVEYAHNIIDNLPMLSTGKETIKNAFDTLVGDAAQNYVNRYSYDQQDFILAIRKYLSEGRSSDYAYTKALQDFAGDDFDKFQYWVNKYVDPSDKTWFDDVNTTEVYRQKLVAAGEIPDMNDYRGIPSINDTSLTAMPNIGLTVILDGDEISAKVVQRTDNRNDIENGK